VFLVFLMEKEISGFHRTVGWKRPLRSSSPTIRPTPPCLLIFLRESPFPGFPKGEELPFPSEASGFPEGEAGFCFSHRTKKFLLFLVAKGNFCFS